MGIGSGIGGQFGLAPEVTYGTFVPPTRFMEVTQADLKQEPSFIGTGGIAAGRLAPLASRRVKTTEKASGTIQLEAGNRHLGLLLQALMGTTVTPVQQGVTTAYLQTHILADPRGKNLSMQIGVPQTDGVVVPYSYKGCKVVSAEFTCDLDQTLQASFDIDGFAASRRSVDFLGFLTT